MAVNWTEDQRNVIECTGCNLLVSAAAGSGKTAVLTQRVLEMITRGDPPVSIDRILIVTYTRMAAGEMRERIRNALEDALERDPGNTNLQRQAVLVHHAKIMTIHSFCLEVIKNHFQTIGLDPSFRVAEEGELYLLSGSILQETLEYGYAEGGEDFLRFSEAFAGGRTDEGLEDVIRSFYEYSMGFPQPDVWRRQCLEAYSPGEDGEYDWMGQLLFQAGQIIRGSENRIRLALEICREWDGPRVQEEILENDLELLKKLGRCSSYDEFVGVFANGVPWKALSRKKDPDASVQKRERVKQIRDQVKKEINRLGETCFGSSRKDLDEIFREGRRQLSVLVELTDRFEKAFTKAKRDRQILDFHDLEHLALQVLVTFENGEAVPNAAAKEYAAFFHEIMIDEYQDSNLTQEVILRSVSAEAADLCPNRFMVGDVKQSIYRFRLARPELFTAKYDTFVPFHEARERTGNDIRIDLQKNFRSRSQVIDCVNRIFRYLMRREIGHIDYDEKAELNYGQIYDTVGDGQDESYRPELILLEEPGQFFEETEIFGDADETDGIIPGKAAAEAYMAAERIREMAGTFQVKEEGTDKVRAARFSDFTVLLRTMSGWGDIFLETFRKCGIPAYTDSGKGYFSALEIRVMLNILSVLDNPRQDAPLAGVLLSPVGAMEDSQLARIRIRCPEGTFYRACLDYAEAARAEADTWPEAERETAAKLIRFLEWLDDFRKRLPHMAMHEIIWKIIDETGYGNYVKSLPSGEDRYANLQMLARKARTFEQGSSHGLFAFVRMIEHLKQYEIDYPEASSGEDVRDAVRIMSVHKSKGLEFPIVFVCGLGRQFNRSSERGKLVFSSSLGVGFDLVDPSLRVRYPSVLKRLIARGIHEEDLGEEERILYVALTRAKEKLLMTGIVKDAGTVVRQWEEIVRDEGERLSYIRQMGSAGILDLLGPAMVFSGGKIILQQEISGSFCAAAELGAAETESPETLMRDQIRQTEDAVSLYRTFEEAKETYPDVQGIPAVMSVSELKHKWMDQLETEDGEVLKIPAPENTGSLSGAERGTLYHKVMELLDFSGTPLSLEEENTCPSGGGMPSETKNVQDPEAFVRMQLETMVKCGKIPKDVVQGVSVPKIVRFLSTGIAQRMQAAMRKGMLHRETPFVLGVDASEIRENWPHGEMIMIQGIIDVWFEEDDGIVLLDYKTDALNDGEMTKLCKRYLMQMKYYKEALERLRKKPVREALLYSFSLDETADVMQFLSGADSPAVSR